MPYHSRYMALTSVQLHAISELEKKIGVTLLAVEHIDTVFRLEVRLSTGEWLLASDAFSEIKQIESLFAYKEDAERAKGTLKNRLKNLGLKYRAIRIQQVDSLAKSITY
jgi:hypothetical protein